MEIVIISEDNHGVIGTATTDKAAKQWLIREGWVDKYSEIWNPDTDENHTLIEVYGDNWENAYINFDREYMECMGFYFHDEELIEEFEV